MALHIEYGRISPIASKDKPGTCEHCVRSDIARWILKLSTQNELWCARCFLYETEWANDNAFHRDDLIIKVESEMDSKITGEDGKLTDDGADRILMSTVMLAGYQLGRRRAKDAGS